jgi:hypothetical protein
VATELTAWTTAYAAEEITFDELATLVAGFEFAPVPAPLGPDDDDYVLADGTIRELDKAWMRGNITAAERITLARVANEART